MTGSQSAPVRRRSPATARLGYWTLFPVTLIECALMSLIAALAFVIWRGRYLHWWHSEAARQRPRRMVKNRIHVENALAAMNRIEQVAEASGAEVFWISGTLLGLERLGQPLPHDNDLDLGLLVDDPHCPDFIAALRACPDLAKVSPQRLSMKTRLQNPDVLIPDGIIRYKTAVRNADTPEAPAVKLDVFLHFEYGRGVVHGTRNSIWWNTRPRMTKLRYAGGDFSVPEDADLYLIENYGAYRQEQKDFENAIDCPNVLNIFSWRSVATLLSRLQMMLKLGQIDRAHRILGRIRGTILKGVAPSFP